MTCPTDKHHPSRDCRVEVRFWGFTYTSGS
jgi:hypothetical protein